MQLSKFTDYSLRVLIYLAGKGESRLSTIDEISKTYDVSKEHLRKIIHHLSKEGWIISKRGRGGGLILAMAPDEISIGQVVRRAEEGFNMADCFDRHNSMCHIDGACKLKGILYEALAAFLKVLDQYTLSDITQGQVHLMQLLGLNIPETGDNNDNTKHTSH